MTKSKQKQLYEVGRLKYLLENKLGEIEIYKEEIKGLREINSLCAAFILYFLTENGLSEDGALVTRIAKSDISGLVGKYDVGCVSDGELYKITLEEKPDEKAQH